MLFLFVKKLDKFIKNGEIFKKKQEIHMYYKGFLPHFHIPYYKGKVPGFYTKVKGKTINN